MTSATPPVRILAVNGSTNDHSSTRVVLDEACRLLASAGCEVDALHLDSGTLPIFNPGTSYSAPAYPALQARVRRADVLLLGTPDYHGCMSGALKNFLDHFWKEYAGRLVASLVGSHEKGLTVADQIRTFARQCYAWALPYSVSFVDKEDVRDGQITGDALRGRLEMMARDIRVYGGLLARQRAADLAGTDPGFLARHRA